MNSADTRGRFLSSGGRKCTIVGVPWLGSVSACFAWGDVFVKIIFKHVLKSLSPLRHRGTPMMARLQLPDKRPWPRTGPILIKLQEHRENLAKQAQIVSTTGVCEKITPFP